MRAKFNDKTKQTTTLRSYYICKKNYLISNQKHHLLSVYLNKIRFLRSQSLSTTNIPFLLESPKEGKMWQYSTICLPHLTKPHPPHSCCYKPSS